jgi:hypothetical protein
MAEPAVTYSQKQAFVDHHLHVPGLILITVGLAAMAIAGAYLKTSMVKEGLRTVSDAHVRIIRYAAYGVMGAGCLGFYFIRKDCSTRWEDRRRLEQDVKNGSARNAEYEGGLRRCEWGKATQYALATLVLETMGALLAAGWAKSSQDLAFTDNRLNIMLYTGAGLTAVGTGFIVYGVHRHRKYINT